MTETKKLLLIFISIPLWFLFMFFLIWNLNRPKKLNTNKFHQELIDIKNNITGDFLLQCKRKSNKYDFTAKEIDMYELAEYIRNTRPIYTTGHNLPYASITFTESKSDDYFEINIAFFNLLNNYGVAVLDCELYKKGKCVASKKFSSSELTDWAIRYFPEVFEQIQHENEKHFYMDIKE